MLSWNGPTGGWLVKCDGCGKETLAEVFPDKVVVYDRRHGQRHVAVISKCEILRIMGYCSPSVSADSELVSSQPVMG